MYSSLQFKECTKCAYNCQVAKFLEDPILITLSKVLGCRREATSAVLPIDRYAVVKLTSGSIGSNKRLIIHIVLLQIRR